MSRNTKSAEQVRTLRELVLAKEKMPDQRANLQREILEEVCACYPRGHYKYPCGNHTVSDDDVTAVFDTLREIKAFEQTFEKTTWSIRFAVRVQIQRVVERERGRRHDFSI